MERGEETWQEACGRILEEEGEGERWLIKVEKERNKVRGEKG